MNITGDFNGKKISPMLLIPFVENSFKHGVDTTTAHSYVHINFIIENNDLLFTIINSKPENTRKTAKESADMGLNNVKRRLELLYPGTYNLEINDKEKSFEVKLKITL